MRWGYPLKQEAKICTDVWLVERDWVQKRVCGETEYRWLGKRDWVMAEWEQKTEWKRLRDGRMSTEGESGETEWWQKRKNREWIVWVCLATMKEM